MSWGRRYEGGGGLSAVGAGYMRRRLLLFHLPLSLVAKLVLLAAAEDVQISVDLR